MIIQRPPGRFIAMESIAVLCATDFSPVRKTGKLAIAEDSRKLEHNGSYLLNLKDLWLWTQSPENLSLQFHTKMRARADSERLLHAMAVEPCALFPGIFHRRCSTHLSELRCFSELSVSTTPQKTRIAFRHIFQNGVSRQPITAEDDSAGPSPVAAARRSFADAPGCPA